MLSDLGNKKLVTLLSAGGVALLCVGLFGYSAFASPGPVDTPAPKAYGRLRGKSIAILATNGFESSELLETRSRLAAQGARTFIIAPQPGHITAKVVPGGPAIVVPVDVSLPIANAAHYHALVLPGGVVNPDELRLDAKAITFINSFAIAKKPIAAICHAPWLLIEAKLVKGRTVTSWPSLRTDLENAGATWVDEDVVTDEFLITSRRPEDIPVFIDRLTRILVPPASSPQL